PLIPSPWPQRQSAPGHRKTTGTGPFPVYPSGGSLGRRSGWSLAPCEIVINQKQGGGPWVLGGEHHRHITGVPLCAVWPWPRSCPASPPHARRRLVAPPATMWRIQNRDGSELQFSSAGSTLTCGRVC